MVYKSTILIVDDEPSARDTLEALLFQEGYDLFFAVNGQDALQKAQELTPDMILLDVMMPGMDGFEVCRRLRTNPLLAEVPVIMVTALDDRDSRLRGIEAGADDFVSKPFDGVELQARTRTVTQLNRYRRLRAERAKFEWVVEQANDGYVMIDQVGRILYANSQAREYLGLPLNEADEEPVEETFLTLAKKRYLLNPSRAWTSWPHPSDDDLVSSRYMVRPETATSQMFWLSVDLIEMFLGEDKRYLVQLRDITSHIVARNKMWTFHAPISYKINKPLSQLTRLLERIEEHLPKMTEHEIKLDLVKTRQSALFLQDKILDIFQYLEMLDTSQAERNYCGLGEITDIVDQVRVGLELESLPVVYHDISETDVALGLSRGSVDLIFWELCTSVKKFHPRAKPQIEIGVAMSPLQYAAGVTPRKERKGIQIRIVSDKAILSSEQLNKLWMPYDQVERRYAQVPGVGVGFAVVTSLVWGVGGSCLAYERIPEDDINLENGSGLVLELILPLADDN